MSTHTPARLEYVGPFNEVTVWWPPGEVHPEKTWTVSSGQPLPDDVPAALRDELAGSDDWRAVGQPARPGKTKED